MKNVSIPFKTIVIFTGLLMHGFLAPRTACGQPDVGQPRLRQTPVAELSVAATENGIFVSVRAKSASAAKLLTMVSRQTNTEVIIKADAIVDGLNLVKVSPQAAIEKVVTAAGLSYRVVNKTYIVDTKPAKAESKEPVFSLQFEDIPIADILRIVAAQGQIKVTVYPSAKDKLLFVSFANETPTQAIEKIIHAGKLSYTKTEQGGYVIGEAEADGN